jgi:indolepyruvate decarboxylase
VQYYETEITGAEYLLTRLKEIGVNHLFGVPGDFVLGFTQPGT